MRQFCNAILAMLVLVFVFGCGHKRPKKLQLDYLAGKKVALLPIQGPKEAALQLEVSFANEIAQKGHFLLVDKTAIDEALVQFPHDSDYLRLGRSISADYVCSINISDYDMNTRKGYDRIQTEDTLLSEEHKVDRDTKWDHLVKVKARTGRLGATFSLRPVNAQDPSFLKSLLVEKAYNSREKELPRSLQLTEELSQEIISKFIHSLKEDQTGSP